MSSSTEEFVADHTDDDQGQPHSNDGMELGNIVTFSSKVLQMADTMDEDSKKVGLSSPLYSYQGLAFLSYTICIPFISLTVP
jgi:hypothetical protein